MSNRAHIRRGGTYFVDDVPDENGQNLTRRRLILIHPKDQIEDAKELLFCGASSSAQKQERIRVPSTADHPSCKTGFVKETWAVPTWLLLVNPDVLTPTDRAGYLKEPQIEAITSSVTEAFRAGAATVRRVGF